MQQRTRNSKADNHTLIQQDVCERPPQYAPAPVTLQSLLTLKVVSESRVKWATFEPILVVPCLSILDIGPMYATDVIRQTSLDVRRQTKATLLCPA